MELKVKGRKPIKRKCFNFKKADWENLNTNLASIDWYSLLDSRDPNESWKIFTNVVHHRLNENIPTITIKGEFNPPWFDSECHSKCREKERLHRKFSVTKSITDGDQYDYDIADYNAEHLYAISAKNKGSGLSFYYKKLCVFQVGVTLHSQ